MTDEEIKAREWFRKTYHTPMDSFLANHGVPVLNGVYEDGLEDWKNIPIEKVLVAYHAQKSRNTDIDKLLGDRPRLGDYPIAETGDRIHFITRRSFSTDALLYADKLEAALKAKPTVSDDEIEAESAKRYPGNVGRQDDFEDGAEWLRSKMQGEGS